MKKNLYKVALLSSALFLVGCGGSNSGGGSSTESGNVGASFQSQLNDIQRQLKDVNGQAGQNQAELTIAEKVLAEKKAALDKAQASVTEAGEVEAAQQAYEEQLAVVAKLTSEAAEIKRQQETLKEKKDTVAKKVSSTDVLSNVGTKLFTGTLTKSDFLLALNGANELTNDQFLPYARKAVAQFNSAVSSAATVKSTVPKMLNSPVFTEFFIPLAVIPIQEEAEAFLANPASPTSFVGGAVAFKKLSETKVQGTMNVKTLVKKMVGADESNLNNPYLPVDVKAQISAANSFIDGEFNKYSGEFPVVLTPTVDTQNPKVLEAYLLDLWSKFKSVFPKMVNDMPDAWINHILTEVKSDGEMNPSQIRAEHMAGLKKGVAEFIVGIKKMGLTALSAEAPASTSAG